MVRSRNSASAATPARLLPAGFPEEIPAYCTVDCPCRTERADRRVGSRQRTLVLGPEHSLGERLRYRADRGGALEVITIWQGRQMMRELTLDAKVGCLPKSNKNYVIGCPVSRVFSGGSNTGPTHVLSLDSPPCRPRFLGVEELLVAASGWGSRFPDGDGWFGTGTQRHPRDAWRRTRSFGLARCNCWSTWKPSMAGWSNRSAISPTTGTNAGGRGTFPLIDRMCSGRVTRPGCGPAGSKGSWLPTELIEAGPATGKVAGHLRFPWANRRLRAAQATWLAGLHLAWKQDGATKLVADQRFRRISVCCL